MSSNETARYITQCLNMSLDLSGETSYTNSGFIRLPIPHYIRLNRC